MVHPRTEAIKAWRDSKRKPCPDCGDEISYRAKKCHSCNRSKLSKDCTLEEAINTNGTRNSAYNLVRYRARVKAKGLNWTCCSSCGYDKHFEVAHIRPISSFSVETMVSTINSVENLIALCPNCHWEFDKEQRKKYPPVKASATNR